MTTPLLRDGAGNYTFGDTTVPGFSRVKGNKTNWGVQTWAKSGLVEHLASRVIDGDTSWTTERPYSVWKSFEDGNTQKADLGSTVALAIEYLHGYNLTPAECSVRAVDEMTRRKSNPGKTYRVNFVPEAELVEAHVDGYVAAITTAGFTAVLAEATVFNATHLYAGTMDVAGTFPGLGDDLVVTDVKTGAKVYPDDVSYQLAAYANATHYANDDGELVEMPANVRTDFGVIWHVRPEGTKMLVIDLARGAFESFLGLLAVENYGQNKAQELLLDGLPVPVDPLAVRQSVVAMAIASGVAEHGRAKVIAAWPAGVPGPKRSDEWTDADMNLIEDTFGLDFTAPGVARERPPRPVLTERKPTVREAVEDPTGPVSEEERAALNSLLERSGYHVQVVAWAKEAVRANRAFNPATTIRRFEIVRTALTLAAFEDDEMVRTILGIVIGEEMDPTWTVGGVLGSLSLGEAQRANEAALALNAGTYVLKFNDQGEPLLVAA